MIAAEDRYPQGNAAKLCAAGFIAALLVWPAVHKFLTKKYDLDPWKFSGWAMYATPPQRASVFVYAEFRDGEEQEISGLFADRVAKFAHRVRRFGSLANTALLARQIYCSSTIEPNRIRISVDFFSYDSQSAMYKRRTVDHFHFPSEIDTKNCPT